MFSRFSVAKMSSVGVALSPVRSEPRLSLSRMNSLDSLLSPCRFSDSDLRMCQDESIMIYLAFPQSMVPMRVLESDSIDSVKLKVQNCTGFVVRNQKLVCEGRELARSNSLVRDYGVSDGNVLHLVLRLSDIQTINVRTVCGKEFVFHVERGRNVGYVKRQIAKKEKKFDNIEEQEVICDGEKVEDQVLIDEISKFNDAVLHLLVRKTAKIRPKPVKKNLELSIVASELDNRKTFESSENIEVKTSRQYDGTADSAEYARGYEVDREIIPIEQPHRDFFLEPVIVNPKIHLPRVVLDMIHSTFDGLDSGNNPIMSLEGTGGAYFMQDVTGQKFVAVFKPMDEEPLAVNNPRGLPPSEDGEGLKKGTRVGEGAVREFAAYVLDHPMIGDDVGFAGVPPTVMIECGHSAFNNRDYATPKLGSLQMFMENNGSCEDIGPGAFPVEEVHKISVLDMRLANADRHAGNILISKDADGKTVLIPIDHGYCLPESFEDCTFEWLYWPQAHQPYSLDTVEYIRSLDAEEDIAILKDHGWDMPLECARTLRISTMLLKKGVDRGLTPYAIGSMMCRESLNRISAIEDIIQEAEDSVLPFTSEELFLETISQIMDRRLDDIA